MAAPGVRDDADWREKIATMATSIETMLAHYEQGDLVADTPDERLLVRHLEGALMVLRSLLQDH